MASDHPDHGAEVEEAREQLIQQPEPARGRDIARRAALAALLAAAAAASAAALALGQRGGAGRGASSQAWLALEESEATFQSSSVDTSYCPMSGSNCTATRCCAEIGLQCYKKNSAWASCRKNCTKNESMPNDTNKDPWDCEEFGPRTEGTVVEDWSTGGLRGHDCRSKKFCAGADDHCYLKNKEWGSCMTECDPAAAGTKGWSCEKLY